MKRAYDVIIVGCGVAGCFAALHLPENTDILMITKADIEESDSFLAQGAFVSSEMKKTMTAFLRIHFGRGIMKTERNLWIL